MSHPGAVVLLTEACERACRHCFNALDPYKAGGPPLLDVAGALRLFGAARGRGLQRIAVSGGEPMLHPGAVAFVAGVAALGLRATLFTSGTGLERHAHSLEEAGLADLRFGWNEFPYLGVDTGIERAWSVLAARLRPAIETFGPARVGVNLIASRRSVPLLGVVLARLRDLGIHANKVQPLYLPDGSPEFERLSLHGLTATEWDAHAEALAATDLPGQAEYARLWGAFFRGGWRPSACGAAPMLVVDPSGGVHPCLHRFDRRLGGLDEEPEAVLDRLAGHADLERAPCFSEACLCLFRPQAPS